jgi:hypothetical protein
MACLICYQKNSKPQKNKNKRNNEAVKQWHLRKGKDVRIMAAIMCKENRKPQKNKKKRNHQAN